MSKRQFKRYTKRLETRFTINSETYTGITSDICEGGLFIRTRRCLAPGSILDIEIYLPDGTVSKVKGTVQRALRTQISTVKNGMGIQILEKDSNFINFINFIGPGEDSGRTSTVQESPKSDFSIVVCMACGAKNRVRAGPAALIPKCGRCKNVLA